MFRITCVYVMEWKSFGSVYILWNIESYSQCILLRKTLAKWGHVNTNKQPQFLKRHFPFQGNTRRPCNMGGSWDWNIPWLHACLACLSPYWGPKENQVLIEVSCVDPVLRNVSNKCDDKLRNFVRAVRRSPKERFRCKADTLVRIFEKDNNRPLCC